MAIENNPNQNRNKKKKSSGGAWGLIILAVIWAINRIDFEDLIPRLRYAFRTGSLPGNGRASGLALSVSLLSAVVGLVVLIAIISVAAKKAKEKRFTGIRARGGGTAAEHSHDRLAGYAGDEDKTEHWKKQLDGFLEAGIIDRSEYRVLLERRRR